MDTNANKALVRRYIEEAWNRGNLAVLDDVVADPVYYRTLITARRIAYPDLQITIDEMIAEGDQVAYSWSARGTHELGVQLHWTGMTLHRIADGKIATDRVEADRLTLLHQLRIFPDAAAPEF